MTKFKSQLADTEPAQEPAPPASLADIKIRRPAAAQDAGARVKSGDITQEIENLRTAPEADAAAPSAPPADGDGAGAPRTPPRRLHKPTVSVEQHELLKQTFASIHKRTTGVTPRKSKLHQGTSLTPQMPGSPAPPNATPASAARAEPLPAAPPAATPDPQGPPMSGPSKDEILAELGHRARTPAAAFAAPDDPTKAPVETVASPPVDAAAPTAPKEPDPDDTAPGRSASARSVKKAAGAYLALRREVGEMARKSEIPAAPANVTAPHSRDFTTEEATTSRIARIRDRTRATHSAATARSNASAKTRSAGPPEDAAIVPPAPEAPKATSKQSVPADLITYWTALRGARPHPSRGELDLDMIRTLWPNTFLFRFGFGSNLELDSSFSKGFGHAAGDDGETGEIIGYTPMVIEWLISLGRKVAREGEPVEEIDEFPSVKGRARYGAVALPLGDASDAVDHVICHVRVE